MDTHKLLKKIECFFYYKLSFQTNCGRNQVKKMYERSVSEAILECLKEEEMAKQNLNP